MLYNVVLYFDDKKSGIAERVHYADLRVNFQRRFIFFGKYFCHLDIDIMEYFVIVSCDLLP